MKRVFALAFAALAVAAGPAAAQGQDCVAAGLLMVEGIMRGTQRVPRDPRSGADLVTISVTVRNLSIGPVNFGASFSAPPVQQDFVTGQTWTLQAGQRTYIALANVLKPGMSDESVRSVLKLYCY